MRQGTWNSYLRRSYPLENAVDVHGAASIVRAWAEGKELIRRVQFFGSRVRGTFCASSDLDVAVTLIYADPDTCLAYWFAHQDAWTFELECALPWQVDLQFHHSALNGRIHSGLLSAAYMVFERAP